MGEKIIDEQSSGIIMLLSVPKRLKLTAKRDICAKLQSALARKARSARTKKEECFLGKP